MKNFSACSRTLLCAAFLLFFGTVTQAQSPTDPDAPPAYGIAQRLQAEGLAARASGQSETAHRRFHQAVLQLQMVAKSREYGHTKYAREALRQQAKIEEDFLQDKNAAIQSLQALHNTFPDDQPVVPEIKRVGDALDKWNQTITPQNTPFHVFGAVLYKIMDFMVALTGRQTWSYALAILMISLLVKLALTPLSNKQYGSMKEMQKLQPYIQELQAKHKNDKEVLGKKMMDLYKEHGVNPAAGCAPMLVQLPILYTLYYMIRLYQFQFSHGTFLWIGSGLARLFPAYLGINLGQPDIPLLLLYAGSMYITQRMTITPTMDPQQAETQRMMTIMTPFMTTYFFLQYHLPSAFVLYYLTFNILSTAQQKYYMRSGGPRGGSPVPLLVQKDSGTGGKDSGSGGKGNGNQPMPLLPNGTGGNGSRAKNGRTVPLAEAKEETTTAPRTSDKFSRPTNGATPTAKGVIAPRKVHPKKKR